MKPAFCKLHCAPMPPVYRMIRHRRRRRASIKQCLTFLVLQKMSGFADAAAFIRDAMGGVHNKISSYFMLPTTADRPHICNPTYLQVSVTSLPTRATPKSGHNTREDHPRIFPPPSPPDPRSRTPPPPSTPCARVALLGRTHRTRTCTTTRPASPDPISHAYAHRRTQSSNLHRHLARTLTAQEHPLTSLGLTFSSAWSVYVLSTYIPRLSSCSFWLGRDEYGAAQHRRDLPTRRTSHARAVAAYQRYTCRHTILGTKVDMSAL